MFSMYNKSHVTLFNEMMFHCVDDIFFKNHLYETPVFIYSTYFILPANHVLKLLLHSFTIKHLPNKQTVKQHIVGIL